MPVKLSPQVLLKNSKQEAELAVRTDFDEEKKEPSSPAELHIQNYRVNDAETAQPPLSPDQINFGVNEGVAIPQSSDQDFEDLEEIEEGEESIPNINKRGSKQPSLVGRQNMQMEGGEYEEYPRIIYLRPKMPKPRLIPVYKNATDADTDMVDRGSDQQVAVSTNHI